MKGQTRISSPTLVETGANYSRIFPTYSCSICLFLVRLLVYMDCVKWNEKFQLDSVRLDTLQLKIGILIPWKFDNINLNCLKQRIDLNTGMQGGLLAAIYSPFEYVFLHEFL